MKTNKPRVFSLGYERLTPDELRALVLDLDVILLDVRSRPSGRVKRGFSRERLEELLPGRYEYRGRELGGFGAGPTVEGRAALAKDRRRLMLMCLEASPSECHRHHGIAVPLIDLGVTVYHVFEREVLTAAALQAALDADGEYEYEDLADVIARAKAGAP